MDRTLTAAAAAAIGAAVLAACAQSPNPAPDPSAQELTLAPANRQDIDELNDFTRVLIDSAKTYHEAAELAQDEMLREELTELADSREQLISEFQTEVASMGGDPAESGGPVGTSHRAFLNLRAAISDNTRAAVAETLRAEEFLVSEIENLASDGDVSPRTREFAARYVDNLRQDRDEFAVIKAQVEERLDAEEMETASGS